MVLSMAVIGIVVAGIYLFIPHDDSKVPVHRIGYEVELGTARRAAPYPVAAPEGLPRTWRATSVKYERTGEHGATWHLGFMDPDNEYVAVEQSDGHRAKFVDQITRRATSTGTAQQVGGAAWERYEGPKYDALVREEGGVTTVVMGTTSYAQLAKMAAALEAS